MGQTTPNIGIYVPSAGETNYDSSFLAGMLNVDQHDHSGPPTKGVPLSSSGIADGSITRNKLNANVVLAGGGLAVDVGSPNALKVDGVLLGIYNIATNGIIVRTGSATAVSRSIAGTANEIDVSNGDGVSGNPTVGIADNPILPGNGSATLPIGTTAQRPGTPVNGMIRYNSDNAQVEAYENSAWTPLGGRAGQVLQVQVASLSSLVTCTNVIPVNDNIPQQTDGDEVITLTITPQFANSLLYIVFDGTATAAAGGYSWTNALFQDAAADALAASLGGSNTAFECDFSHTMVAGTTSPTTFKVRIGPQSAGTIYVNGVLGNRIYGGVAATSLMIWEIAQ